MSVVGLESLAVRVLLGEELWRYDFGVIWDLEIPYSQSFLFDKFKNEVYQIIKAFTCASEKPKIQF